MDGKIWQNPGLDSEEELEDEEEDEIWDSEDETDKEEGNELYGRDESGESDDEKGVDEDEAASEEEEDDEDGEEGDDEIIGRASKIDPLVEDDRRVKGQTEKGAIVEEYDSSSEYGNEESSDEELPKCIAPILASDRVTPGDNNVKKVGSGGERPSKARVGQTEDAVVKDSKRSREEVRELEETPVKRRKENGARDQERKSPFTKGKPAHSQSQKETLQTQTADKERINSSVQMPQSNKKRTDTSRKKSSKQKHFAQDESQTQDSGTNEEPRIKDHGPQKNEKADKKHRGPEDGKAPLECIELESKSKMKNQEQQRLQLPAENGLKFQQSQQPISPQEQKKPAAWSRNDEITLASGVKRYLKLGGGPLSRRADYLWDKISEELHEYRTADRLYGKVRRMKCRYMLILEKMKAECSMPFNYKNEHEEHLFKIWNQIWGTEESKGGDDEKAVKEDHEPSEPMVKTEPSNPRKKVKVGKELLPPAAEGDANETLQECTTPLDLDQTHLPTSALATLANVSLSSGPLESSANHMQQHQHASALNSTGDPMLAQPGSENPSMTEILKLMCTSNQVLLEEVQSHCNRMLGEVQAKTRAIVENSIKSAAKGCQFYNGMNYLMPSSFPMPSLAIRDAMDIKIPDCNKEVRDKLMHQWHEQHLQELKIFSQRLHLMQEQCRIQQDELNFGKH